MVQGPGGQSKEAKRYAGLICTLKSINYKFHCQHLSVPSQLIKLPCDPKTLLSKENQEILLHILIPPSKANHLNINGSCHLQWGKVDRRTSGKGEMSRRDTTHLNMLTYKKELKKTCIFNKP